MPLPHFNYPSEYLRPWKLATLACGIGLLVAGSFYYRAPDWDIPISLIMAFLTYLTAPWSMRALIELRWRLWPWMLFFTWAAASGNSQRQSQQRKNEAFFAQAINSSNLIQATSA